MSTQHTPSSRNQKSGFTLVELVIVIVVLGALASIAVPRFIDFSGSATEAKTREILGKVRSAIATARAENALPSNGGVARNPTIDELKAIFKGDFPDNPYSVSNEPAQIVSSTRGDAGTNYGVWGGWAYNEKTGEFWAYTTSDAKESNW